MSKPTPGRRLPDGPLAEMGFSPGDYGKTPDGWYCRDPRGSMGNLNGHEVIEHDDRTITVTQSILIRSGNIATSWHGFLRAGQWTEC